MPKEPLKIYTGKTRDVYRLSGVDETITHFNSIIITASDRLSVNDKNLQGVFIKNKGVILTLMSVFWFNMTRSICPNHLIGWRKSSISDENNFFPGRSILVKNVNMIEYEVITRGYLYGSIVNEYFNYGTIGGNKIESGLQLGDKLSRPIVTFSKKVKNGIDFNVPIEYVINDIGKDLTMEICKFSEKIFLFCYSFCLSKGITLIDSKLEYGLHDGILLAADEMMTPDSCRMWMKSEHNSAETIIYLDRTPLKKFIYKFCNGYAEDNIVIPHEIINKLEEIYKFSSLVITGVPLHDFLSTANDS